MMVLISFIPEAFRAEVRLFFGFDVEHERLCFEGDAPRTACAFIGMPALFTANDSWLLSVVMEGNGVAPLLTPSLSRNVFFGLFGASLIAKLVSRLGREIRALRGVVVGFDAAANSVLGGFGVGAKVW